MSVSPLLLAGFATDITFLVRVHSECAELSSVVPARLSEGAVNEKVGYMSAVVSSLITVP